MLMSVTVGEGLYKLLCVHINTIGSNKGEKSEEKKVTTTVRTGGEPFSFFFFNLGIAKWAV